MVGGLLATFLFAGCTGSIGDGAGAGGGGGATSSGGSGANGANGATTSSGGGASSGGATTSSSGGATTSSSSSSSGDTGKVCDPMCTGTMMCDAADKCVCSPGHTFDGTTCVAAPISDPMKRTKDEVCQALAAASKAPATQWTPGMGGACDPGTVPYDAEVAAITYLNFYRWMIGVGPVQVVPAVAKDEQACAVILNYYFGHDPMPGVMCYTPEGAAACGSSLIAGGYGLIGQVDGYALETGQNFIHHRNVLAVGRAGVWFGANAGSSDMHYGGAYTPLATDPKFVAHPGPGLQVRSKVPTDWWFVERGTDTTPPLDARVFVKATNEEKPMMRQHHYNDFSSFQPSGWVPAVDTAYRVQLVDDAMAVFSEFETTFIDCP